MTADWRTIAAWLVALSICGSGFASIPKALSPRVPVMPAVSPQPLVVATIRPDSMSDDLWRTAPFRADRRPPSTPYTGTLPSDEEVASQTRPEWLLTGLFGGPQPIAVFEEAPGHPEITHVLSVGDEVNGYRIDAILGDSAIISSGDSTWSFTMVQPWR